MFKIVIYRTVTQAEIEEISARFQSRSTCERECGGEHLHALSIETVRKLNTLLFYVVKSFVTFKSYSF